MAEDKFHFGKKELEFHRFLPLFILRAHCKTFKMCEYKLNKPWASFLSTHLNNHLWPHIQLKYQHHHFHLHQLNQLSFFDHQRFPKTIFWLKKKRFHNVPSTTTPLTTYAHSPGLSEILPRVRYKSSGLLTRGPFLKSPETLQAIFGCHNSLCISRTERI